MRINGFAWGAAITAALGVATAQAAPKGATAAGGAGGGSAAATSGGAPTSAPSEVAPAAGAVPGAATPATPGAPAEATTPETPDASSTPPEATPDPQTAAEEEEEAEEEARRRKRKRRRQRALDADEAESEDERSVASAPAPVAPTWRLVSSHFMLSAERLTNLLSWSITDTVTVPRVTQSFNGPQTSESKVELERSGTDASFLGSGGASLNVFSVPRVGFDGMFENGLTLGGSLSYLVTSGKHDVFDFDSTTKRSENDPGNSIFILAPRVGMMIPASPTVGIWLRGGISRISLSSETNNVDFDTGEPLTSTSTSTVTLVNLTLDPQLVIAPVPHVGITLGALLDIGVSGTAETSGSTTTSDVKASSYGVSGGLVAIF